MTYSEMKKDVPDCAYSHELHLCFSLENIEGGVLASFSFWSMVINYGVGGEVKKLNILLMPFGLM